MKGMNFEDTYREYMRAHRELRDKLLSKGLTPNTLPLTKEKFMIALEMEKNAAKYEGKHYRGNERTAKLLARNVVYDTSYKQAIAFRKAEKALGLSQTSITELRTKGISDELKFAIQVRADDLRRQGMNSKAIALTIGQEYFGSD